VAVLKTRYEMGMWRPLSRIATSLAKPVLSAAGLVLILLIYHHLATEQTEVPWKNLWFWFENEGDVATIRCVPFRIGFEGESWSTDRSAGNYLVDGRYPFGSSHAPIAQEIGHTHLTYEYAPRKRLVTFRFQGHTIKYSDRLKTLTVDGQELSTAQGQLTLLVKRNGEIGHSLPPVPPNLLEDNRRLMRKSSSEDEVQKYITQYELSTAGGLLKNGTGSELAGRFPGKRACCEVPVPIFQRAPSGPKPE
jgi:hypothetical protein